MTGTGQSVATGSLKAVSKLLGDRYEVLAKLSSGAYGEVYKAQDTVLNRTVAIKRIRLDAFADSAQLDELKRRFLREAQVAAQLQHPNIVSTYDIVTTPEMSFIVMEFIDGETLQAKLASAKGLDLATTLHVVSGVAEALDHAHERKVVHRDVKPANIMIASSGQIKVTDFGIAKAEFSSNLTTAGVIMGTPDYMSPEQARGEPVGARSDLFSLGCILYECLTGERPFKSDTLTGVLLRIISSEPAPVDSDAKGLPAAIHTVLSRSLAKDPSERFGSGAELVRALRSIGAIEQPQTTSGAKSDAVSPPPQPDAAVPSTAHKPPAPPGDSVADSLMQEARRATRIEPHLAAFLKEERRVALVSTPSLRFENVQLTPQEGFILSRIDGSQPPRQIFALSPMSEEDTARTLLGLLRAGFLRLEGEPVARDPDPPKNPAKRSSGTFRNSDEAVRKEVQDLFELCQKADYWQILGLKSDASLEQIKQSFHERAFRFHPDRFGRINDPDFHRKVSLVFCRVNDAFTALSKEVEARRQGKPVEERSPAPGSGPARAAAPTPARPPTDRERAKVLFQRAQTAFDARDYFQAIECCRAAVGLVKDCAEYFHLLGLALYQNPKWRKEAEENLKKATELDPMRAEYFGALGELYQSQGLTLRARKMFATARAINPSYAIPDDSRA